MKKGDLIIIIVVFIAAITFGNFVSTGKLDDTKTVIVVKAGKEIHAFLSPVQFLIGHQDTDHTRAIAQQFRLRSEVV